MADVDIVEFLRARYDERRDCIQLAEHLIAKQWGSWQTFDRELHACCNTLPGAGAVLRLLQFDGDPAYARADLAAKVRILRLHGPQDGVSEHECKTLVHGQRRFSYVSACFTLKLLAVPYGGHPDFDSSWALPEVDNG